MGRRRRTFTPIWKVIGSRSYHLATEPNLFASKKLAMDVADRERKRMHWSVRVVPSRGRYAIYVRRPGG